MSVQLTFTIPEAPSSGFLPCEWPETAMHQFLTSMPEYSCQSGPAVMDTAARSISVEVDFKPLDGGIEYTGDLKAVLDALWPVVKATKLTAGMLPHVEYSSANV